MLTKTPERVAVAISAPNLKIAAFRLIGEAPYCQSRMSQKAINSMREKHEAGSVATKGKKREPRDFNADYENAKHVSRDGWIGIPASAFRAAAISACRLVGFKMTLAKLSLFIEADGYDKIDGIPLVKIQGECVPHEMTVRNATGVCDIRVRPIWYEWSCDIRVRYDADQFTLLDVTNLLLRVGQQVGIGEGRPDSRESAGLGWGMFTLEGERQ